MQKPVDQQPRRLVGIAAGLGQDLFADVLEVTAKLVQGRHRRPFGAPAQEGVDFPGDDLGGDFGFGFAGHPPGHDDPFQVAQVIEKSLLDAIDGGIDVAGDRSVDQKHRPFAAPVERHLHHVGGDGVAARAQRRQHDVGLVQ